jgi:NADH-quinone oxidoreductase subunit L
VANKTSVLWVVWVRKCASLKLHFFIGCVAIAGIPPFAGFFSKDEILAAAFAHNPVLYFAALAAALMTAFYMFRLYFLTFSGKFRGTHEQEHHLHESPLAMTFPLIVLAILATISGFVGLPAVISEHHSLNEFLSTAVSNFGAHHLDHNTEYMLMGLSVSLVLVMIGFAYVRTKTPNFQANTGLAKILENKWYVDELYDTAIVNPLVKFSGFLDRIIERKGIDGGVNGVGKMVRWGADRMRMLQNGQVGAYLFTMVIGIVLVFVIGLFLVNF